jgi:phage portal protein BeeE
MPAIPIIGKRKNDDYLPLGLAEQAIKSIKADSPTPGREYLYGALPVGFGTHDIPRSKAGAAACYKYIPEVNNCVSSITGGINSLPWNIIRYEKGIRRDNKKQVEGEVLASNSDLTVRHPFQRALKVFQKANNMAFIPTVAFDYALYGEVFLEIALNNWGYNPIIEWLNPLGVEVFANHFIEVFRYGWNNNYIAYKPHEITYLHNRDVENDFIGFPVVLSALNKVNITLNLDRFLRDYFHNNGRPGMAVMPNEQLATLSDKDHAKLLTQIRESLKGAGNQFNSWVLQRNYDLQTFEQPDLAKNSVLSKEQSDAIYEKFSVPRALRGNTSATAYKDGDETTRRFYLDAVIPLAQTLQQFINAEVMPYYDQTIGTEVFEFDTSMFDLVTSADQLEEQIVSGQVNSGYLTLADAQRIQERPVDPALKNRYMIRGLPMTLGQVDKLIEAEIAAAEAAAQPPGDPGLLLPPGGGTPSPPTPPPPPGSPGSSGLSVGPALGPRTDEFLQRRLDEPKKSHNHDSPFVTYDSSLWENIDQGKLMEVVEQSKKPKLKSHNHDGFKLADWQKNLYADDPDEMLINKRIEDELKTWQKFASKHFQKSTQKTFEPYKIPPYITHSIIDGLDQCKTHDDIRKLFAGIMDNPAIKSVRSYQQAVREFATGLWRGEIGKSDFEDRFRVRMTRSLEEAFISGVEQGGLTRQDLDPEDFDELIKAVGREQTHIGALADYIDQNSKANKGKLNVVRARVDRWAATYSAIKEMGYLISKSATNIMWVYNKLKENCVDCARLNGKVFKGRTWKRYGITPQSKELACFGLWCGCRFEDTDKPVTRGRPPKLVGSKSTLDWLNADFVEGDNGIQFEPKE